MIKNTVFILAFLLIPICTFGQVNIDAKSFLIEGDNGQILYKKNLYQKLPMASTTKIMTSLVALENADIKDEVIVSKEALKTPYEHIKYRAGDKITLKDLCLAVMIDSSNQGASVICENIKIKGNKGKVAFIQEMNRKAKVLGMLNTSYKNPHGLDTPEHYSTSKDLIVLARYAMKNPSFRDICGKKSEVISIKSSNGDIRKEKLKSTFYDFLEMEGAEGIKTGTTTKAKSCFVGVASDKNAKLFICILGAKKNASKQAKTALNYCFENWNYKKIINKDKIFIADKKLDFLKSVPSKPISIFIPKNNKDFYDTKVYFTADFPVYKGDIVGYLNTISKDEVILNSAELVSLETKLVPRHQLYFSYFILIAVILFLLSFKFNKVSLSKSKSTN